MRQDALSKSSCTDITKENYYSLYLCIVYGQPVGMHLTISYCIHTGYCSYAKYNSPGLEKLVYRVVQL